MCDRRYVFDAQAPGGSNKPLSFSPTGRCPAYEVAPEIAGPALEKQKNDDYQIAQLTKVSSPVAPVLMGTDGGMNREFFASKLDQASASYDADGHLHAPPGWHPGMPPPTLSEAHHDVAPETTSTVASSSPSSSDSKSGGLFSKLFGSKSSSDTTKVASADTSSGSSGSFFSKLFSSKKDAVDNSPVALRGSEPTSDSSDKGKSGNAAAAGLRPKKTEPSKSDPKKVDPQIADGAEGPTGASTTSERRGTVRVGNGGLLKGAQLVVPTGSFDRPLWRHRHPRSVTRSDDLVRPFNFSALIYAAI